MTPTTRCPNLNHGRSEPPIRACPMCGSIVNSRVLAKACSDARHAQLRRERNAYCADCGKHLAVDTI